MADQMPLGSAAKTWAQAALAASEDAETTWIEHDGRRVAAIVPCDVALRGDWRKAQAGPDSGAVAPPAGDPVQPVTPDDPDRERRRANPPPFPGIGRPYHAGDALAAATEDGIRTAMAGEGTIVPRDDSPQALGDAQFVASVLGLPVQHPGLRYPRTVEYRGSDMRILDQHGRQFVPGDTLTIDRPGNVYLGREMPPGSRWVLLHDMRLEELTGDEA